MSRALYYITIILLFSCAKETPEHQKYPKNIGDIAFDKNLDNLNFKACNEEHVTVYYAFQNPTIYKGEKPAMVRDIMSEFEPDYSTNNSGYITVRFLVNCMAKTGRFRIETLDFEYNSKTLDSMLVGDILNITKSLDGWEPATYKNEPYDYYKYLTFKIVDNQLTDILP